MLSDENIANSILYRAHSKTNRPPFLVPVNKDSLSTMNSHSYKLMIPSSSSFNQGAATASTSNGSRRSIRLLRPETIKRAITDAAMAASIGDVEWLKQTFKILPEMPYDKNGFMTIHIASIHARLKVIKYLIEERKVDVNLASTHGWRPVHLCISNQVGPRAIECLRYLVEKGAEIEVKNDDGVYPLHMAASEGQVDCLKFLLDLKADTTVTDCRGQTALDLAKLWGHRLCAKLLNKDLWHQQKEIIHQHELLEKRVRTQDILREIEEAHNIYYDNKDSSQKNFDKWLIDQGFMPSDESPTENKSSRTPANYTSSRSQPDLSRQSHLSDVSPLAIAQKPRKLAPLAPTKSETRSNEYDNESTMASNQQTPYYSVTTNTNESPRKSNLQSSTFVHHEKEWNYSTKPSEKSYVTNLNDFYPRDPYTFLPKNIDLVTINRELKGMSLEQVKEFIKKQLPRDKVKSSDPAGDERPVLYKPVNIVDAQTKATRTHDDTRIHDELALALFNEPKSFQFKQVKKFIKKSSGNEIKPPSNMDSYGSYYNTAATLRKIKKQLASAADEIHRPKDEKLDIVSRDYGQGLSDFMRDRNGQMSQKYEKVFIC